MPLTWNVTIFIVSDNETFCLCDEPTYECHAGIAIAMPQARGVVSLPHCSISPNFCLSSCYDLERTMNYLRTKVNVHISCPLYSMHLSYHNLLQTLRYTRESVFFFFFFFFFLFFVFFFVKVFKENQVTLFFFLFPFPCVVRFPALQT